MSGPTVSFHFHRDATEFPFPVASQLQFMSMRNSAYLKVVAAREAKEGWVH